MSLSARATVASAPANGSLLWDVQADLWNPDSNPQGYVSLGMAENVLMQEALLKRVAQVPLIPATAFTYGDGTTGSKRLKNALGAFLTKHFHAYRRVKASHITITNGCSAAIEHLAWAFGNQDDFFLVGKPFFRAFVPTTGLRVATNLISVPCEGLDPFGIDVVQNYEGEIVRAHGRGQKVAGIILCNPHNPLGRCYTRDAIIGLMRLCQKHKLHLISDEVYGLSTFTNDIDSIPPSTPFTSCLSVDTTNIVDPALIHVVWGFSKDFGSNGIRLAAVISQENPALHRALVPGALYSMSSSLADHTFSSILEDESWVDDYLVENRRLLARHHKFIVNWARDHKITYAPGANAAFFLWADLGKAYRDRHPEKIIEDPEKEIMAIMLQHKVFLAPGQGFGAEENGWFRLVFSINLKTLTEGLSRVMLALEHQ
ncbi:hypothetical protein COL154_004852 [Colletotrichum chrysophilum]|uniref:Aspartate aminotransferase n=1 Tax=Colletotrichum chrysophilum TaxID=1836956 RepID=A0AAD9AGF4_9PEZI|nr:hypothetical protein COL154_004852 [Colletotrichum chrysophilum]KAK1846475.1 aspartate aminotransferase [Colletotrichum chrysophilum]